MDFPAYPSEKVAPSPALAAALGAAPKETFESRDGAAVFQYLALFANEDEVRRLTPDFRAVAALGARGVIATAPGSSGVDFVSRYFAPAAGIDEDPVTGGAHCRLIPFWAKRLGKERLHARQVSARGGELFCLAKGERVEIAGKAVLYLEGWITV
jgi:predicted PhzF superfamily epimerase YddE/YHI9